MKKLFALSSITFASASLLLLCGASSNVLKDVDTSSTGPVLGKKLASTIDLNDSSEDEIRSYYSSLTELPASQKRGNNLLKNLKPILQNLTYYKYDDVWKIYEITDREWSLSPAISDSENGIVYNGESNSFTEYKYGSSNSKGGSNPYVHTLYRNRDENGITLEGGRIKEWGDHNATGTNREHVWCQSRGFKASSGAEGPAGTDVHHLISGDGKVNQSYHNNSPYGYVDKTKEYKNASKDQPWLDGNLLGPQLHQHAEDQASEVFEPQDSDKGDIARACFYMAACYNNWSGNETITQFNPNLILVDYATNDGNAEDSSSSHPVAMGILSDLLEWHKLDPVDEYEIHRNNLIFKNYQYNRNPFIDFPEWVDIIWGDAKDSETSFADPVSDKIATPNSDISLSTRNITIAPGESKTVTASVKEDAQVTWSIKDESVATIETNGNSCKVTGVKEGVTELVASVTIDNETKSVSCIVEVHEESEPASLFDQIVDMVYEMFPSLGRDGTKIAIIAAAAIVVIIILIIFLSMSKKKKKKIAKKIEKNVKKQTKKTTKTKKK